jgi:hypothetical protein
MKTLTLTFVCIAVTAVIAGHVGVALMAVAWVFFCMWAISKFDNSVTVSRNTLNDNQCNDVQCS